MLFLLGFGFVCLVGFVLLGFLVCVCAALKQNMYPQFCRVFRGSAFCLVWGFVVVGVFVVVVLGFLGFFVLLLLLLCVFGFFFPLGGGGVCICFKIKKLYWEEVIKIPTLCK